tara:strand:- start:204 stop:500 length:297 start_codon:yes stop_codon:yes gene_type:complete
MIDELFVNRNTVPYAIAVFCIVLSVFVGYLFGYQAPSAVCAEYIIQADTQTKKAHQLNEDLTQCQSIGTGKKIIECGAICNQQIEQALKDHKNIICED